jgi:hypothetical protein
MTKDFPTIDLEQLAAATGGVETAAQRKRDQAFIASLNKSAGSKLFRLGPNTDDDRAIEP